jgi:5-dehydro-2-deoxygluconokinase
MTEKKYDVLTYGRSSIDLYSANIGAAFVDIRAFNAYVGGSPLNIAVGTKRLGLRSALLTGIGQDQVGDFLLNFLNKEGVETKFIRLGHVQAQWSWEFNRRIIFPLFTTVKIVPIQRLI